MARNKHPEETVKKILDVSMKLFLEKGYDHTTLSDIIQVSGLSKGAIYHHFASKAEILIRICDRDRRGKCRPAGSCQRGSFVKRQAKAEGRLPGVSAGGQSEDHDEHPSDAD